MSPVWLVLIVPTSMFLGLAIMCWISARATDDLYAAIARRDEMIKKLCILASSVRVGLRVYYEDGVVHRELLL